MPQNKLDDCAKHHFLQVKRDDAIMMIMMSHDVNATHGISFIHRTYRISLSNVRSLALNLEPWPFDHWSAQAWLQKPFVLLPCKLRKAGWLKRKLSRTISLKEDWRIDVVWQQQVHMLCLCYLTLALSRSLLFWDFGQTATSYVAITTETCLELPLTSFNHGFVMLSSLQDLDGSWWNSVSSLKRSLMF